MTDQELKELVASLAINHQKMAEEAERTRKEAERIRQEDFERTLQEAERTRKEAERIRQEDFERTRQEAERTRQEAERARKEIDKVIKELSKQIGGIANKFGSFTEGLALPSMTKILTEQFGMTTINPSVRVRDKNGNEQEIDVLAYANGKLNTAFIVEVKSHLREEGIEQLLKQCRDFPVLFPELADKKLYGILAAVDANQHLQQKVLAQGLYFAKIHDEQFSLCVPTDFKPYCFTAQ